MTFGGDRFRGLLRVTSVANPTNTDHAVTKNRLVLLSEADETEILDTPGEFYEGTVFDQKRLDITYYTLRPCPVFCCRLGAWDL